MLEALTNEWNHWVAGDVIHGRKVPINPNGANPDYASVDDRFTWGSFDRAYACMKHFDLQGVGFVFTEDDPFVGVDLDDCRDPETGDVDGWAREILEWFKTYVEISPSGTGLHIVGKGELRRAHKNNDRGLEVYSQGRFFCFTGEHLDGYLDEIHECQDGIGWLEDEYFGRRLQETSDDDLDLMLSGNRSDDWVLDKDDWLQPALEAIDPDCTYDDWISVGMALHDAYDGDQEGLDLWDRWSQEGDKYEGTQDLLSSWRAFSQRDGPVKTLKTVWWLAEQYGWHGPSDGEREEIAALLSGHHESVVDESDVDRHEVDEDDPGDTLFVRYAESYRDRSRYPDFLIEPSVLGPGDTGLWFGPPKSYKTMSTMAMSRQFAQGRGWHGMEATRPLTMVHLNFEMRKDRMRERQHLTWHAKEELDRIDHNYFYSKRYGKRLSQDVYKDLVTRAEGEIPGHIDVLIVDPAVNFFPGDNENDNVEVSKFLNGLRVLAKGMGSEDTALVLVHHTGKTQYDNPFQEIRGASAFRGAYDSALHLHGDPDENHVVHFHSEMRNGPGMDDFSVRFCPSTGEFVSNRGEGTKSPWSAGRRDKAKAVIQKLQVSAQNEVLFTKQDLCQEMADSTKLDVHSNRSARRLLVDMLQRSLLAYFDPEPYGGPSVHVNGDGYLCCKEMTYQGRPVRPTAYQPPRSNEPVLPIDDRWWGNSDPDGDPEDEEDDGDGPFCGYANPDEFVLTDMMQLH